MINTIFKEKTTPADVLYRLEFVCDSEDDVQFLPNQTNDAGISKCATGSIALIVNYDENKTPLRILTSDGNWQEVGA